MRFAGWNNTETDYSQFIPPKSKCSLIQAQGPPLSGTRSGISAEYRSASRKNPNSSRSPPSSCPSESNSPARSKPRPAAKTPASSPATNRPTPEPPIARKPPFAPKPTGCSARKTSSPSLENTPSMSRVVKNTLLLSRCPKYARKSLSISKSLDLASGQEDS